MSRFYVPKENIKKNSIYIDGREARHILNVMRLVESDPVVVFDGTGAEYKGFIKKARPKSLIVEIVSTMQAKREGGLPEITLVQAIPKREKMDFIIEKATELGVSSIIPVVTERTIAVPEEDKRAERLARWKKIAIEAAKQCGRQDVAEIKNIQKFYNFIYDMESYDLILMACLAEGTMDFKAAISNFQGKRIIVFIGPEGDFTPDEIEMAKTTKTCKFISLGKRVLKSDTAGLYVLSVLNYAFS